MIRHMVCSAVGCFQAGANESELVLVNDKKRPIRFKRQRASK